ASACTGESFVFQAEDGIRADLVTGVQTCALPISCLGTAHPPAGSVRAALVGERVPAAAHDVARAAHRAGDEAEVPGAGADRALQIGRASCRERALTWVAAVVCGRQARRTRR